MFLKMKPKGFTLKQCQDLIAQEYNYKNWNDFNHKTISQLRKDGISYVNSKFYPILAVIFLFILI